ncbi:MAG: magnesium/cobalt transporter CorA [Cyclobacteriaceae bacterium]
MKQFDIIRPDKVLLSGLKILGDFSMNLYSGQKSMSKGTGQITFIGKKKVEKVESQLYTYNKEDIQSTQNIEDFAFFSELETQKVYWLNFHGLHEVGLIEDIGKVLNLNRITTRQILDTTLRPKVDEYDHYVFFSVKSVLQDELEELKIEQLSFVLGKNYVVSFQEERGDHFDHIRNKMVENLGLIRRKGADFLAFQLLDAILDNYFETIEAINEDVRKLEKIVLKDPTQKSLIQLEHMKQLAEMVKKSLNPFKDSLKVITNRETVFIHKENVKYFQDLGSSCTSAIEEIDSTIKSLEGLTNIYFSSLSQKMNETMKVLTTVATVFIPLTFIAGIYGMNFENMPELRYQNGYFMALGAMGVVFVGMLVYFKRKKWL